MDQLPAQNVLGLEQRDLVAPLIGDQSRLHACRTAADHGHFFAPLRLGGIGPFQRVAQTDQGIDRANGPVAFVTAQTGDHVGPACVELLAVFRVADEGPGHGYHVRFALGNVGVDVVQVLEPAHRGADRVDPPGLEGFGVFQTDGAVLRRAIGAGVGQGAVLGPNLKDVHQLFLGAQLGIVQEVFHGVASGHVLLAGDLALDQKVRTAALADFPEQLQGEPGPVFQAAAVFVLPLVVHRG